jgi:hypothetical protein
MVEAAKTIDLVLRETESSRSLPGVISACPNRPSIYSSPVRR